MKFTSLIILAVGALAFLLFRGVAPLDPPNSQQALPQKVSAAPSIAVAPPAQQSGTAVSPKAILESYMNAGPGRKRNVQFLKQVAQLDAVDFVELTETVLADFAKEDKDELRIFLSDLGFYMMKRDFSWVEQAFNLATRQDLLEQLCPLVVMKSDGLGMPETLGLAKLMVTKPGRTPLDSATSILLRVAKQSPEAATNAAKEMVDGKILSSSGLNPLSSTLSAWARSNESQCIRWMDSNLAGDQYRHGAQAIVGRWLSEDSVAATEKVKQMPEGAFKNWGAYTAAEFCIQKGDQQGAFAWADSIKDPAMRSQKLADARFKFKVKP